MTNEESTWLEEGGALTRQERDEAGQTAVAQERGLAHLPGDLLARIHRYDAVTDQGVDLRTEQCAWCRLGIYEGNTERGWRWFSFAGYAACPTSPDHLHHVAVAA